MAGGIGCLVPVSRHPSGTVSRQVTQPRPRWTAHGLGEGRVYLPWLPDRANREPSWRMHTVPSGCCRSLCSILGGQ